MAAILLTACFFPHFLKPFKSRVKIGVELMLRLLQLLVKMASMAILASVPMGPLALAKHLPLQLLNVLFLAKMLLGP
eukprot:6828557-Ditylum_brightwellii.AAC.1